MTTAPTTSAGAALWRLGMLHTKYTLLETLRVPMAVIGPVVFPALSFLFFVVPQRAVVENAEFATQAVIQLIGGCSMSEAIN